MSYISAKSLKDSGSSVYVEIFTDVTDYTSGTTTTLTTTEPLPAANSVWVYFDGVVQHHSEYGVSGYSVIFTSAIPLGTNNVEVQFNKLVNVGVPGQNTVTYGMLTADNADKLQRKNKNVIINGNFDVWQRDTTQTTVGYGSDDRWTNQHGGTTKVASRQTFTLGQTDVPNNPTYYSRTVVTSVAGAGNFCVKRQRIENVSTLAGETATISFWAKADATKNIAVEVNQIFGTGGTPSAAVAGIGAQQVTLTTSWAQHKLTITIPSITGKTLGTNNNDYLLLTFWFDAGTNYDANTASLGQQNGTFDIAQVQVEKGDVATEFERRTVGEEEQLCYRYYQFYDSPHMSGVFTSATNLARAGMQFHTKMRAIPNFTSTGTISIYDGLSTSNVTGFPQVYLTRDGFEANADASGGAFNTNNPGIYYVTPGGWSFQFDAEL